MSDAALARAIFADAVRRLDPSVRVAEVLRELPGEARVVLAVGKAAGRMAAGAQRVLGERLVGGLVVAPAGDDSAAWVGAPLALLTSAHPVPDDRSERAGRALLAAAAAARDPIIALISGGASALAAVPVDGVSLADKVAVTSAVMAAGAPIGELNAVRRQLSAIKGGQLAAAASVPIHTLVASDVVGDQLDVVGSGPTMPSPPASTDPVHIVEARCGLRGLPESVRAALTRRRAPVLVGYGDQVSLVAGTQVLLQEAAAAARAVGWEPEIMTAALVGDVCAVAERIVGWIGHDSGGRGSRCLVAGGEPTVQLPARPGRGGRAQQLALLVARELAGRRGVTVLVAGSDGIDGNTSAAGAVVDGQTYRPEMARALVECDAHSVLREANALVVTGRTGVNHADLVLVMCASP